MGRSFSRVKIYTTVEAVPSRIAAIVRLLATMGPLQEEELSALLQPRTTNPGGSGIVDKVLPAAAECGVIARNNRIYALVPEIFPRDIKPDVAIDILPRVLTQLVLRPQIEGKENQFALIASWFLHRPVDDI